MIFQGIRTSIAKKPYIFMIFKGGGPDPPYRPLDPPMSLSHCTMFNTFYRLPFAFIQKEALTVLC